MTSRERIKRAIHVMRYATPATLSPLDYGKTMSQGVQIIRDNWPLRESVNNVT